VLKNDLVPPFFMRDVLPAETRKGAGFEINLPKRGEKRDAGGVPCGQLNQNNGRLCRLDNPERRRCKSQVRIGALGTMPSLDDKHPSLPTAGTSGRVVEVSLTCL